MAKVQVTVYLPIELYVALERISREEGKPFSETVRKIISEWIMEKRRDLLEEIKGLELVARYG